MTVIAGRRALAVAQRGAKNDLTKAFQAVAHQISAILFRNTDASGSIPARNEKTVLQDAGDVLQRMFVGTDGRSAYADDGVTPLAIYPRVLNKWLIYVTSQVVYGHRDWMQRTLPEDVFNWLASHGRVGELANPYLRREGEMNEAFLTRLGALETLFRPNPLAKYEAPHTWVDSNGYRLSDRIWRMSVRSRMQLDALLTESIRAGMGSLELSRLVERFLLPNRASLRTKKPYGTDGSFDAMRLARTEISHAHAQASYAAAVANPYVDGGDWALSPSHPKTDICDQKATIGMNGERLRDAYPLDSAEIPPAHSQCLCVFRPRVTADISDVTQQLRAFIAESPNINLFPYTTPANAKAFIADLIGHILTGELGGLFTNLA